MPYPPARPSDRLLLHVWREGTDPVTLRFRVLEGRDDESPVLRASGTSPEALAAIVLDWIDEWDRPGDAVATPAGPRWRRRRRWERP